MEEILGIKKKIKEWEHAFRSKENRQPTKEDIDKNETGIREDYVRYSLLKERQSNPDGGKLKDKIPEWKKISTKNFSFERKTTLTHETSLPVIELANEEANKSTAFNRKRVHLHSSTEQDDVTGPRLPHHYNLVQKQRSGLAYRRSISADWIERHCMQDDVIVDSGPALGEIDHTPSRCERKLESTLFDKLYEKEIMNEEIDTQHIQLDIENIILTNSVQTEHNELPPNKTDPGDTTLTGVLVSLSNDGVVREDVRTDAHIRSTEESDVSKVVDSPEPNELKEEPTKKQVPKSKLKLTPLKSFRLPSRYTPTLATADDTGNADETDESEAKNGQKRSSKSTLPASKRPKFNTSISNNFVRLDMKRKHYKAKGRGMSAKSYKRKMFHKKQFENDSGGVPRGRVKGGGTTRCFKCGETGHWARNCTEKVAESDLGKFAGETCSYQDATEEDGPEVVDSPLPTLSEAALMSRGRSLFDIRQESGLEEVPVSSDPDSLAYVGEKAAEREQVTPLFPSGASQEEIDKKLKRALKELKHAGFREGQREAVTRILQGESTMVLLGTGGGKSLCYQLPAMLYTQREVCVVLVISPLVSLMEDQCLNMPAAISATCLHTNQTAKQREKILLGIKENKFSVILVSPEMLASQEKGVNEVFARLPPIPFVCIDEVHCLSQWSHNFRPSYMRLCKVIREKFGVRCVLALTATATRRTVSDLMTRLGIEGDEGVIKGPILPENLQLSVSRAKDMDRALIGLFQSEKFASLSSIIVYCTRQKETERIAQILRTHIAAPVGASSKSSLSLVAECYHAGMSAQRRHQVQKGFMNGKVRIVAATLAFGMGLNKADVRAIVHYNMPSSCENYVQEVGRAGRDGVTSFCHAFLDADNSDLCELKKHAFANGMDKESLEKFVDTVFPSSECVGECNGHMAGLSVDKSVVEFDIPEGSLSTLLCYCEEKGWLDLLRQQYDTCNVKCYGGEKQLRKLAEKMPVIAAAIALQDSAEAVKKGCVSTTMSAVSRRMGWEYAPMKRELGSLSYNDRGTGGRQRSSVIVEMTELTLLFKIFHRDDNACEDVVRYLGGRIEETEKQTLTKLSVFSEMLTNAAERRNQALFREAIRSYFEDDVTRPLPPTQTPASMIPRLRQDIGGFIMSHSDSKLTGRVIARILHGISSPNYPAYMWGSTMYWRRHMDVDFHLIRRIAEKELERL